MIDYEDIIEIHHLLLQRFGGPQGVKDENALRSAIARPFSGFGPDEFYPTPEEKASAMLESVVTNHPFIDGNKRTGYVLMRLVLLENGMDIRATQDEKYDFVIAVASGKLDYQQILAWIRQHVFTK